MKFYLKVTSCVLLLLLSSYDKNGNDLNTTSTYLALGDSYTIGQNVVDSLRWPVLLVKELNKTNFKLDNPTILAKTGWTTDELLSAMNSDLEKEERIAYKNFEKRRSHIRAAQRGTISLFTNFSSIAGSSIKNLYLLEFDNEANLTNLELLQRQNDLDDYFDI